MMNWTVFLSYAPINVKPPRGGGRARGGDEKFDQIQ